MRDIDYDQTLSVTVSDLEFRSDAEWLVLRLVCPAVRQQCPGRQWSGRQRSRRAFTMPDKSMTNDTQLLHPAAGYESSLKPTSVSRRLLFIPKMHCILTALEGLFAYGLLAYLVNIPASDGHPFLWQ